MKLNVIAAVRTSADYDAALCTDVGIVFDLNPCIQDIADRVINTHKAGKKLFVHLDLAEGIGKDRSGIQYLSSLGVDGIISTRASIIKYARETGMFTVQRFFIVDGQSLKTAMESVKSHKPDMIEIMPGIVTKVICTLRSFVKIPIISGGLIETEDEIRTAISNGAYAISTSKKSLWSI